MLLEPFGVPVRHFFLDIGTVKKENHPKHQNEEEPAVSGATAPSPIIHLVLALPSICKAALQHVDTPFSIDVVPCPFAPQAGNK